jgi:hypothetical protein
MNREVHVRIWEGLGVKFLGPTLQDLPISRVCLMSGLHPIASRTATARNFALGMNPDDLGLIMREVTLKD